MSLELAPGVENVVRFPLERRTGPGIETVRETAPPQRLTASILEERGLPLLDIQGEFREQTARQALLLEGWLGRDGTVLQLRAMLDVHVAHAAGACRQYLDAADAMVRLEVRAEALRRTSPWLLGTLNREVARARAEFRDRVLAARGAADAALGFADALAGYIRSAPEMVVDSDQLVLPLSSSLAASG
jgi:hypothetical protein